MFLTHPNNKIQAIQADTGELIWEYQYAFPPASKMLGGPTRNIALWDNKYFWPPTMRARGGRCGNRRAALAHPESRLS